MQDLAYCFLCAAGAILLAIVLLGPTVVREYRMGELMDTEAEDGAS